MSKKHPASSLIYEPCTTQIPNIIIDYWMPILSDCQFKVLMAITRKTLGWHKIRDRISICQLSKMTGFAERNVQLALRELVKFNLVTVKKSFCNNGNCNANSYELNILKIKKIVTGDAGVTPPGDAGVTHKTNNAKTKGFKGNAYNSYKPEIEKIPDKPSRPREEAMLFTRESKALGTQRKYKRSESHQEAFEWLSQRYLTDSNGGLVNEDTLSYLSAPSVNSLEKLQKCYAYLRAKLATENIPVKNLIGQFRNLLKKPEEYMSIDQNVLESNIEMAKTFREENKWWNLKIGSKFAYDDRFPGSDVHLCLPPEQVMQSLMNLHNVTEQRPKETRNTQNFNVTFDSRMYD